MKTIFVYLFNLTYTSMKRKIFAVLLCSPFALMAQHQNIVDIFHQIESLPPYMSTFMEEYTHDINNDLNRAFLFNLQTDAAVLDTGDFTFGIIAGAGVNIPHSVDPSSPLYDNYNIRMRGQAPTVFNGVTDPTMTFIFMNPNTDKPLIDPTTGDAVLFDLDLPGGLDMPYAISPAGALSLGYGLGFGTEVRAYITPKFGAAAAAYSDDVAFKDDWAFGLSAKHDIATWIPALRDRGWHLSVDAAYSYFGISSQTDILGVDNISIDYAGNYDISIASTWESMSYQLNTYGARLFVGKSFSWIDFSAYAGYVTNSYSMSTQGGLVATLSDNSGSNPDETVVLENIADFEGSTSNMAFGASTTIGKGWFRTSLAYTYAQGDFVSLGFHFVL